MGSSKVGELRAGRYQPIAAGGRGDITGLDVAATGAVWLERCVTWGDNPEEEGCLRELHVELPPGGRTSPKAPRGRVLAAPTTAPTTIQLTAGTVKGEYSDYHLLDCDDGTKHALLSADDQVFGPVAVTWLSAAPPIALLAISYPGAGEGADSPTTRFLRGCTLGDDDYVIVQLGPDGLWAERTDSTWTVHRRGATLGTVAGDALVFAGGSAYAGL